MKVFLTGATGFIGGRLAHLLTDSGHRVVALVRHPDRAPGLASRGIELPVGDITDPESLMRGMRGADAVFHVAGWYRLGATKRGEAEKINVTGTRNVLEAMRSLGIPRGVYTSSLAVFSDTGGRLVDESYRYEGRHLSEYDRAKWLAHYAVAEPMMRQGLPLTIVQPGVVYGPGDTSLLRQTWIQFLQGRLAPLPERTAYCWAHIEDVARGHILALERGKAGESYILAGPAHTVIEAIEVAEQITGIPAPRLHLSPRMMRSLAWLSGLLERFLPLPGSLRSEALRVNAGTTYLGSAAKAKRELGYAPRSLREGLTETLEHERRLMQIPESR